MARQLDRGRGDSRVAVPARAADELVTFDGPELPLLSRVCTSCRHFWPSRGRTCAAFSVRDSIPLPIWLGEHDHRTPYPGDHGIQYEPVAAATKSSACR